MTLVLGNHRLASPWILAPMAGVSDAAFRPIAYAHGAAAAPTELVSAKGLLRGSQQSEAYLERASGESFLWVQVFGGEAALMADAAKALEDRGVDAIDINMGCPVKKITRKGGGASLLRDQDRAVEIVRAMSEAVGIPVTAKIRGGWDGLDDGIVRFVNAMGEAGAAAVAVHARSQVQGYEGRADWKYLEGLVRASKIAIIGNGDAFTAGRARALKEQTGCAAVMIGRGALGNPWIFSALAGQQEAPSGPARWPVVLEHYRALRARLPRAIDAVRRFRQHWRWYAAYFPGLEKASQEGVRIDDEAQFLAFMDRSLSEAGIPRDPESVVFESKKALG